MRSIFIGAIEAATLVYMHVNNKIWGETRAKKNTPSKIKINPIVPGVLDTREQRTNRVC